LHFDVLAEIRRRTEIPLVLHGGTGIPLEDLAKAVKLGICKVNIATAGFQGLYDAAKAETAHTGNYFTLSEAMVQGVCENTKKHIRMFAFEN